MLGDCSSKDPTVASHTRLKNGAIDSHGLMLIVSESTCVNWRAILFFQCIKFAKSYGPSIKRCVEAKSVLGF
jgi:hypothetical protein